MTAETLQTAATYLKGVGPKGAQHLHKLGLETVRDVLFYMPRRYEDRRNLPTIASLQHGQWVTVKGRVTQFLDRPTHAGRVLMKATLRDDSGHLDLVFFNQPWLKNTLGRYRGEVVAYGQVKVTDFGLEIASPEWEGVDEDEDTEEFARLTPVYPLREGVPQPLVRRAARAAVDYFAQRVQDPYPDDFRREMKLQRLAWSLRQIHWPEDEEFRQKARQRLAFDEFLGFQLKLAMQRHELGHELGIAFPLPELEGRLREEIERILPFRMTGAQERVVAEIWKDMAESRPMNRLVQGDVGSGKTAVAACALLAAVRSGRQAVLMAPTEILAEQHTANLRSLFDPFDVPVELLVGKLPASQKKAARRRLASGEAGIAVGTHALITDDTELPNLGLVVIDEQHRFGVLQRKALRDKARLSPDVLVMTATPIPRTLTMAVYGDLDLSVIDEMPPGRTPIRTHAKSGEHRESVYRGVRKFIEEGRQVYVVCPMIGENEKVNAQAAVEVYDRLANGVFSDFQVALLHGQMPSADKETTMDRFRQGEVQVLVSTTVIEVGVDVPNASVMVVEDADRFGLAQLHQLRGRVGRGAHQSHCVLIASPTSEDGKRRLEVMVRTTDGFEIADEDLRMRGPGVLAGVQQSGNADFQIADLAQDGRLLAQAQGAARMIIDQDRVLESSRWRGLRPLVEGAGHYAEVATVS